MSHIWYESVRSENCRCPVRTRHSRPCQVYAALPPNIQHTELPRPKHSQTKSKHKEPTWQTLPTSYSELHAPALEILMTASLEFGDWLSIKAELCTCSHPQCDSSTVKAKLLPRRAVLARPITYVMGSPWPRSSTCRWTVPGYNRTEPVLTHINGIHLHSPERPVSHTKVCYKKYFCSYVCYTQGLRVILTYQEPG